MKNKEVIDVEAIKTETQRRPVSLKLKWSIGTAIGATLIFAIFAVLLFQCFSSILLKQQKRYSRNALEAAESKLIDYDHNLTPADIQKKFNINFLSQDKAQQTETPYKDSFVKSVSHENITISIYNVQGKQLFSSRKSLVKFKPVAKEEEERFYQNGNSVLLVREPLISTKNHQKIGYVQVTDRLVEYDKTRQKLVILFIIIGVTVCFAIALMSYWLSSLLLQPIDSLNEAIHKINNNDDEAKALSEVRVPVVTKGDELSELSILFNKMLDKMQRYVEQQQQFVGDVSHELRTPVAIIQGHLDLLKRWGKDDPKVLNESINASLQEIDRMKKLVQEMLDLSRAEQVEIQYGHEVSDAREVGIQVYNDFKMIHPDFKIILDNDLKKATPVRIYRNHLEQILIILLDNAVKYSNKRKEVHITLSKNTRYAEFLVQDFGEGIAKKNIKKIFDRFYRVDKARSRHKGGNGLGLSIAERLVEGYHGKISVESAEGEGSLFKVELPLVKHLNNNK